MKRYLITLFLLVSFAIVSDAQIQYYRTTGFAMRQKTTYGWTNWTDWEDSNMTITIDLNRDLITIYSPTTQRLQVTSIAEPPYDSTGRQVKFNCWDKVDNIPCSVRLRIENNGNSQIYVDWVDVSIVYNVIRTN